MTEANLFPELNPKTTTQKREAARKAAQNRRAKLEDYDAFVEKFKSKKTTDDCYTPGAVYDAVLDWVDKNIIPLEGRTILRPFKPGGDYEAEEYPEGCVVIDNPPFSILAKIRKFYNSIDVPYFLFAPALTLFSSPNENDTYIAANASVIYENGACVHTSFVTNILGGDPRIIVAGDLYKSLKQVQELPDKTQRKIYPPVNVISGATLGRLSCRGIRFEIPKSQCQSIRKCDNVKGTIFGGGFLLSTSAAAERAAAERAAAERAAAESAAAERAAAERVAAETFELSPRERAQVRYMDNNK